MAKECMLSTGKLPLGGLPRNKVVRIMDRPGFSLLSMLVLRHEKTCIYLLHKLKQRCGLTVRGSQVADQHLCFHIDSTIPLLPNSAISSL